MVVNHDANLEPQMNARYRQNYVRAALTCFNPINVALLVGG